MELECVRCTKAFDAPTTRGYCSDCLCYLQSVRDQVNKAQRPQPGVMADGKFTKEPCPVSVWDAVGNRLVCGLCGSDEVEQGYGLGSGHGMGSYRWCNECQTFLDFREDTGE